MFTVKIMNDFFHSPIWIYDEEGDIIDEPSIIANDATLQTLCDKVENIFSSYYEFDSQELPCKFNYDRENAEKEIMIELISGIKERLKQINDGRFVVVDLETERLKNLSLR